MKKVKRLHRGFSLLTLITFLTFGQFLILPNEMYADTSTKEEPGTTEQTDETAGASEQADGTAGASEQKFEHYEPLPVEPIHREANNVLLGSGLMAAMLIIGWAVVKDRRNGN
ncbi:hypothetical protein [Bacillus sp. B15-48]|uniref:hypothetical protein n=1 Tax=Bacillus sp. B15-48 TaxID=1548601 RepID=UPI00193F2C23|nr:hypothetical protein [Bacillus sp. B15-48]MBM4763033.1 hypothetical protein [Bacillus sp. B15-48]